MIIFEANFCRMEAPSAKLYNILTWNGFFDFEQYKEVIAKILDGQLANKRPYMLSDLRKITYPSRESQLYLTEYVLPQICQNGVNRWAMILPEDLFSKLLATQLAEDRKINDKFLSIRVFDAMAEAEAWLA